jgi:hypothetical protein
MSEITKDSNTLIDRFKNIVESYDTSDKKPAIECISEIIRDGAITFNCAQMTDDSINVLRESLNELCSEIYNANVPVGESIYCGNMYDINTPEQLNSSVFQVLTSGKYTYGYIRFYESVNMGTYFTTKIRDFIPLEKPHIIEGHKIKESLMQNALPKTLDLKGSTDDDIKAMHEIIHDVTVGYCFETNNQPEKWMIQRHALIESEMQNREIVHNDLTELDKLSKEIKHAQMYVNLMTMHDVLKSIDNGFTIKKPLLCVMGDEFINGESDKLKIHINWPLWDENTLSRIIDNFINKLPIIQRDTIEFIPGELDDLTGYMPIADLKIEMHEIESREVY